MKREAGYGAGRAIVASHDARGQEVAGIATTRDPFRVGATHVILVISHPSTTSTVPLASYSILHRVVFIVATIFAAVTQVPCFSRQANSKVRSSPKPTFHTAFEVRIRGMKCLMGERRAFTDFLSSLACIFVPLVTSYTSSSLLPQFNQKPQSQSSVFLAAQNSEFLLKDG